jgi:glutamine amidotransferase
MCRLYAFRSAVPSRAHRSLMAAENALIKQSDFHPDGWGIAYYVHNTPHIYRNENKALADGLFKDVSSVVSAKTLLGHIRRATVGAVSLLNCHPFQYGNWTFAHNGSIAGFAEDADIRARVRERVDPYLQRHVLGATDSELFFFAFLTQLARRVGDVHELVPDTRLVLDAGRAAVDEILGVSERQGEEETRLTWIATNGGLMVGHRLHRPLFFSTYKSACPERDSCPAYEPALCEAPVREGVVKHMILTSEKVTENPNVWTELSDWDMAVVDQAMHFAIRRPSA